jgi:anti-sigma regulatory factor (Ser/Thr protein kinase)
VDRAEAFVSKEQQLDSLLEVIEELGREEIRVVSFELIDHPSSVSKARAFAQRSLLQWELDDLVPDAVVIVSELVTNAILHANSECELRLSLHPKSLRIAVVDYGPGMPEPQAPSATNTSGRGLQIIDTLSFAWGVDLLTGNQKLVWAELNRLQQPEEMRQPDMAFE